MAKVLCALVALALCLAAPTQQLRLVERDGNRLLEVTEDTLAMSGVAFNELGWKCVSINGMNNVTIWKADGCQVSTKRVDELNEKDAAVIKRTYRSLHQNCNSGAMNNIISGNNIIGGNNYAGDYIGGNYYAGDYVRRNIIGSNNIGNNNNIGGTNNIQISTGDNNWIDNGNSTGEEDFILSGTDLGDNVAGVSVKGDLVAFIYRDTRIQMKPIACLNDSEKQQLELTRTKLKENKKKLDEDMAKMREQLANDKKKRDEDMAKMREQLAKDKRQRDEDMAKMREQLANDKKKLDEEMKKMRENLATNLHMPSNTGNLF